MLAMCLILGKTVHNLNYPNHVPQVHMWTYSFKVQRMKGPQSGYAFIIASEPKDIDMENFGKYGSVG